MLMVTGCGAATTSPPMQAPGDVAPAWQLLWLPPAGGVESSVAVQTAFVTGAKVDFRSSGVYRSPARIEWLATGPHFGLALVQLDDAGRYKMIVHMEVSSSAQMWIEDQTSLPDPVRCDDPSPLPGAKAILGNLCSFGYMHTLTYDESIWTEPSGAQYFADRTASTIQRPANNTKSLTLEGAYGWMLQENDTTVIVLPVTNHTSFIFIGVDDPTAVEALCERFYPHRDVLFSV